MTHYFLFASATYYPYGGLDDCRGVYATRAEAEAAMTANGLTLMDDYHVLQVPEMLVYVYDTERRYVGVTTLEKFMGGDDD